MAELFHDVRTIALVILIIFACVGLWLLLSFISGEYAYHTPQPVGIGYNIVLPHRLIGSH